MHRNLTQLMDDAKIEKKNTEDPQLLPSLSCLTKIEYFLGHSI